MKWSHLDGIQVNTDWVWLKTFCLLFCNIIYQFPRSVWVLVGKLSQVRHFPSYIPEYYRNFNGMVRTDRIQVDTNLVWWKSCSVIFESKYISSSRFWGMVGYIQPLRKSFHQLVSQKGTNLIEDLLLIVLKYTISNSQQCLGLGWKANTSTLLTQLYPILMQKSQWNGHN